MRIHHRPSKRKHRRIIRALVIMAIAALAVNLVDHRLVHMLADGAIAAGFDALLMME